MPSLLRLLVFLAVLAVIGYAAMYVLAHYGQPQPREITVPVTPDRFQKN